jgi:hypothetical protein
MRGSLLLTLTSALALAACNQASAPANVTTVVNTDNETVTVPAGTTLQLNVATPAAAAPAVNLASDGLSLVLESGSSRQIGFGMDRGAALPALIAALGKTTDEGTNPECGAGPLDHVDFKGGLTAFFQEDKFVGWDLDGREGGSYATADGIGIGATRAQLEAAGAVTVDETTIGHEFAAGELYGLLSNPSPSGKVTNMWAGTNCIFR